MTLQTGHESAFDRANETENESDTDSTETWDTLETPRSRQKMRRRTSAVPRDEVEAAAGPPEKTSYESNADVQRWLKEQSLEQRGTKPEFTPTFLAHQRDRLWVLSSLARFYEDDLITDVTHVVKSGKEATVYCCTAHPAMGARWLAAKVYRPRMFRSLHNDVIYRESRAVRDEKGRERRDGRHGWRGASKKSERGRAAKISSWIEYEFDTMRLLYTAGADVPRPMAQIGNAVLMEYVGDEASGEAAPLLREVTLAREEAQPLFERVMRNIELWLACDRIHGDLSAYNMLYHQGVITIIDFAQAVDPRYNADIFPLLARDVERVCRYFARFGVEADAFALADDLWSRYMRGTL
ncbi:MAG: RIO1 family regulatory kinase/ATPase domain-containing protein [Ktedonobacterales bacterium]